MVSFRATPRLVSFRGLIQNFRQASLPLSYAESPPLQNCRLFLSPAITHLLTFLGLNYKLQDIGYIHEYYSEVLLPQKYPLSLIQSL